MQAFRGSIQLVRRHNYTSSKYIGASFDYLENSFLRSLHEFASCSQDVPENKRHVSVLKGIVIARRNAGLNTTFRIRRLVAGVGVESVYPLYSPNIKEIKGLDKKKVRRAKLYYLRDRMNPLKK